MVCCGGDLKEKYDNVKCSVFTRLLRQVLTIMQLNEAEGLLDLLKSAAADDRKGIKCYLRNVGKPINPC